MKNKILVLIAAAVAILGLAACSSSGKNSAAAKAHNEGKTAANNFNSQAAPPKITHHMDYQNFYRSQELYDNPSTILWCTFTWGNANSPLVTVPVAGKLTSSSVSLNPTVQNREGDNGGTTYNPEIVSSDGMYHGSPPPYRYGFTPGGQYVDFFNTETFCTTALTDFQRQKTQVQLSVDSQMASAQARAEQDLADCTKNLSAENAAKNVQALKCEAAQKELEKGLNGG